MEIKNQIKLNLTVASYIVDANINTEVFSLHRYIPFQT